MGSKKAMISLKIDSSWVYRRSSSVAMQLALICISLHRIIESINQYQEAITCPSSLGIPQIPKNKFSRGNWPDLLQLAPHLNNHRKIQSSAYITPQTTPPSTPSSMKYIRRPYWCLSSVSLVEGVRPRFSRR